MQKQYKVRDPVRKNKAIRMNEPVYKKRPDDKRGWNRQKWLKVHPEDRWIDDENQIWRKHGWDDDGFRQLCAAICLRVCVDYKNASMGRNVDGRPAEEVIDDCRNFFGEELFQFFVNRIPVPEIEKIIRATPKDSIHNIWRNHENNQATQAV